MTDDMLRIQKTILEIINMCLAEIRRAGARTMSKKEQVTLDDVLLKKFDARVRDELKVIEKKRKKAFCFKYQYSLIVLFKLYTRLL